LRPNGGAHRPAVRASWPRAGGAWPRAQGQLSLPQHQARTPQAARRLECLRRLPRRSRQTAALAAAASGGGGLGADRGWLSRPRWGAPLLAAPAPRQVCLVVGREGDELPEGQPPTPAYLGWDLDTVR